MDNSRPPVMNNAVRNELGEAKSVNGGSNPDTNTNQIINTNQKRSLQGPLYTPI